MLDEGLIILLVFIISLHSDPDASYPSLFCVLLDSLADSPDRGLSDINQKCDTDDVDIEQQRNQAVSFYMQRCWLLKTLTLRLHVSTQRLMVC